MKKEERSKIYHIRELKNNLRILKRIVSELKDNLEIQEFLNELVEIEKHLNNFKTTAQLYIEKPEIN